MRHFLTTFFQRSSSNREHVLYTLSLLDSALPEIHFLNFDLLNRLMVIAIHGTIGTQLIREDKLGGKKVSSQFV